MRISKFDLRFSLRSFLTLNWAILLLFTQLFIFSISSPWNRPSSSQTSSHLQIKLDNQSIMSIRSASNQTTTPGHQIRPQIKPLALRLSSDPTTKSDHQIRTPDYQTTDHRPQTTILVYSASKHSLPNLLKCCRLGAFFMGWVRGGI